MINSDTLDRLSIQTLDDLYDVMTRLEDSILKSSPVTGDATLDDLLSKATAYDSVDLAKSRSKLLSELKSVKKLELVMSLRPSKSLLDNMVKKARAQLGSIVLDVKYDQEIFAGFIATFEGKKYNYSLDRHVNIT